MAEQYGRRDTLDPQETNGDSTTLTLDDLQTFLEHDEEYNQTLRAVTFEVDDAVTDPR
ncbi:hypothetical protein [Halomarina oriensis]|uniref:Uncharacterized protein n=1 Tax=Halomarina oriensis TaxID=671145 RepID=A0A6B0GMJ3_9EURY|nr:hypothetical protein [Halomarina oriensis]MWG36082.1 hypothetical protein [Halomarina oriensis]